MKKEVRRVNDESERLKDEIDRLKKEKVRINSFESVKMSSERNDFEIVRVITLKC